MITRLRAAAVLGAVLVGCTAGQSATFPASSTAPVTTTAPPSTTTVVTRPPIESISDCSPLPQSVGAPEPGGKEVLGPVVVFFEQAVSDLNRTRVTDGVRAAQRYVEEMLGGFRFDEPICFDVRAGAANMTTVGVVYGANHIVVYTGAPPLVGAPGWLLSHVAAHEHIHFWQKDIGSPRDGIGPTWLLEGSAELLAYEAIVAAGLASPEETRAYSLRRVPPNTPSLQSMERRSPNSEDFSYALAFLGCELLISGHGPESFRDYWRGLARGASWEAAFTEAFAVGPEEFYRRFEEHRRAGFPR